MSLSKRLSEQIEAIKQPIVDLNNTFTDVVKTINSIVQADYGDKPELLDKINNTYELQHRLMSTMNYAQALRSEIESLEIYLKKVEIM
jgi:hypothetical protein